MLAALVDLSVRHRVVVLLAWLALGGLALLSVHRLSIDAIPDVTNVQVSVITTAPGLSPVEVEQYLTFPVETAMNGLPKVEKIRSISRTGVSLVTIIFHDGMDLWFARQLVGERINQAKELIPSHYGSPTLAPVSTALGEIYEFYLSSPKRSAMELRTILDWDVIHPLRSVPGVIEINAMGGALKQYQVRVKPHQLAAFHVSFARLTEALARNNLNVGSGYIEKDMESTIIRGEAQVASLDDIRNTVVTTSPEGTPVLVRHLADVALGAALRFGTVTKHGEGEIVAGTVMMLIGSNSRDVVIRVKDKLQSIGKTLPPDIEIRSYYDRSEFIGRMLHTVFVNLLEGAGLVVVLLCLALGSLRAALIASCAIPLSMSFALFCMIHTQIAGTIMSLGAIDFGLLVDGAIVMLEAALLQLAHADPHANVAEQVSLAMRKVARPVVFALLIILLVYLPLMSLQGAEGRMFLPMAVTIAYALAGALLYSLTAVPALAALTLKVTPHVEGRIFRRLQLIYTRALDSVLTRRKPVLFCVFLMVLGSLALAGQLGAEFVPRLDEGELSLDVKRLPSISLSAAKKLGEQVEKVLADIPEVLSIVTRTGRAEVATDPVGPDEAEIMVKLRPREEWSTTDNLDTLGEFIKTRIESRVPATFVAVSQPIEDSINQLLAGSRADVAVKVFGDDLFTARKFAESIKSTLAPINGTGDLRVERVLGLPLLNIKLDRMRLARYGLDAAEVLDVVQATRQGKNVGYVFERNRRFDLTVLAPPDELTPEGFGDILVRSQTGQMVPLAAIADIEATEGPSVIKREDMQRRVMVEVNLRNRDMMSYVTEARAKVDKLTVPEGIHIEWGGQFDNFTRARDRLVIVVPVALAIIFVMLFFMFGDARYAMAVFFAVPLALIGGIVALALRGLPFSIPAAVGFIAVGGVCVLNGVIIGSQMLTVPQAGVAGVKIAALASLRPILTTALVAAIGFIPMALSSHAGAEMQRPLATVVIGGILSSTFLSLLVLPILFSYLLSRSTVQQPAQ